MGTSDISRINFDAAKHYSSVRMQQGRILTDDDYNEDNRIHEEEYRRSTIDIIGPYGSPDEGFLITNPRIDGGLINFDIQKGNLYLGGMHLELEQPETYRLQKDWLQQSRELDKSPQLSGNPRYDLVFVEAWQQEVSAVEDEALFEVALGGPDTTTRVRTMRRVRLAAGLGLPECNNAWQQLLNNWKGNHLGSINKEYERITDARLKITYIGGKALNDLCTPDVAGGYLGAENQAIRVQIVSPSSFTWGFDNASPLYRVTVLADGRTVHMLTEPKDQYHWPLSQQVVELLPWSAVLSNGEKVAEQTGHLTKVEASFNPDTGNFTLRDNVASTFGTDWKNRGDKGNLINQIPPEYFYLRVWNRGNDLSSPPRLNLTSGIAVTLGHTGLQITITGNDFVAPDFWVIAARPDTPNQVVPWELEKGMPPQGVRRFFAPLAVIQWGLSGTAVTGKILSDCRIPFHSLTDNRDTCVVALPVPGWEKIFNNFKTGQDICVCFKNAVYELQEPVVLRKMGNIKFTGCGKGSQIIASNDEAAFVFEDCKDILVRDLSVAGKKSGYNNSSGMFKKLNGALTIRGCENVILENLTVSCENPAEVALRQTTCITVSGNDQNSQLLTAVAIRNCQLMIGYMQTGILITDTQRTVVEGNTLIAQGKGGNQGIVIAGTHPENIFVRDNVVKYVLQGIHIGTSNNKTNEGDQAMADSVLISGNTIDCILEPWDKVERHGIFVGNCNSLVLSENYIRINKGSSEDDTWPPTNGIRVYGYFGKRIIIKDNDLAGFGFLTNKGNKPNYGILIKYLNTPSYPKWWIVEANVTEKLRIEGAGRPFRTSKMIYADRWRKAAEGKF